MKINKWLLSGQSIINGIAGDRLKDSLGITMKLFKHDTGRVRAPSPEASGKKIKLCVFIHGLTNNENIWISKHYDDFGSQIMHDFGFVPYYVRYNTGLHISDNGQQLAKMMETLTTNSPYGVDQICFIGHSMGGLVAHSACHYACLKGYTWVKKLRFVFLLGTPHLGSYVEKLANVTTNILKIIPNLPTRLVGKFLDLRSAGIKDLRFGYLTENDWRNTNPDAILKNNKTTVRTLKNVHYYVISSRLTKKEKHWLSYLFGDILVSRKSATARSGMKRDFNFPDENHFELPATWHHSLTYHPLVYDKIKEWIGTHDKNNLAVSAMTLAN